MFALLTVLGFKGFQMKKPHYRMNVDDCFPKCLVKHGNYSQCMNKCGSNPYGYTKCWKSAIGIIKCTFYPKAHQQPESNSLQSAQARCPVTIEERCTPKEWPSYNCKYLCMGRELESEHCFNYPSGPKHCTTTTWRY